VAFLAGMMFAVIGGIWGGKAIPENDAVIAILIICGIFIGLINISAKEVPIVLGATVTLVLLSLWFDSSWASWPIQHLSEAMWENMFGIIDCFAILMVPAAVIISLRAIAATANKD